MAELCSNFGDSAITKGQIAYFSLRMRKTALFLLPVKNLTSPLGSPTPISYVTREFWQYVDILGRYCVFLYLHCVDFQDLGVKNGGSKIRERVGRYWPPTNSFLLLGVYTSVSNLKKIDKEMRPWEWRHTDRQIDTQTDRRITILLSVPCYML